MTTIAYDGRYLVADGQETSGNELASSDAQKIHICPVSATWKIQDFSVKAFGFAGCTHSIYEVIDCLSNNLKYNTVMSKSSDFMVLCVAEDRKAFFVSKDAAKEACIIYEVKPKSSIGSGYEIANNAMRLGKNAIDAVKLACEYDVYSGGQMTFYDVKTGLHGKIK
jgi:hypothetical protein